MRLDKFTEKAQEGKFSESDTIQVDAKDGVFVFTKVPSATPAAAAAG